MFLMRRDVYFNCRDVSFLSGGRHLQNEMYILSEKMYISTGEMYLKYTSLQLKYTSHSLSGGRQIHLAGAR